MITHSIWCWYLCRLQKTSRTFQQCKARCQTWGNKSCSAYKHTCCTHRSSLKAPRVLERSCSLTNLLWHRWGMSFLTLPLQRACVQRPCKGPLEPMEGLGPALQVQKEVTCTNIQQHKQEGLHGKTVCVLIHCRFSFRWPETSPVLVFLRCGWKVNKFSPQTHTRLWLVRHWIHLIQASNFT